MNNVPAIPIHSGRQEVVSALVLIDHTNLVSGTSQKAVYLPAGAVIVGGFIAVTEAFNSGTSDTFDFGSEDDEDSYGADIDLTKVGVTPIDPDGVVHNYGALVVEWTGEGAEPTAGKMTMVLNYVVQGRAAFSHGPDENLVDRTKLA